MALFLVYCKVVVGLFVQGESEEDDKEGAAKRLAEEVHVFVLLSTSLLSIGNNGAAIGQQ